MRSRMSNKAADKLAAIVLGSKEAADAMKTRLNAHNGASKRSKSKTRVVGRRKPKIALERELCEVRRHPYLEGILCRADGAVFLVQRGTNKAHWTYGCVDKHGYRAVGISRKVYKVHRLVCEAFHGLPPADKCQVDHINRTKDDNRPENLRWANQSENNRNRDVYAQCGISSSNNNEAYHREWYSRRKKDGRYVLMADGKIHYVQAVMADALLKLPVKKRVLHEQKGA